MDEMEFLSLCQVYNHPVSVLTCAVQYLMPLTTLPFLEHFDFDFQNNTSFFKIISHCWKYYRCPLFSPRPIDPLAPHYCALPRPSPRYCLCPWVMHTCVHLFLFLHSSPLEICSMYPWTYFCYQFILFTGFHTGDHMIRWLSLIGLFHFT